MIRKSLLLSLLLPVAFNSASAQDAAKPNNPIPLPQETSDIPSDPAITWGVLDNGMRYAILPNEEPPNRVSLRLFVDAGSLMEADNQQGLAHFLEHMAFNGTKNFPAGEMVEYFQRLGMGFGNHTNAHTSFNETVYKLELPNSEEKMIDEGIQLLRDYADGMLLLPDEIEDERGVIMSEKRTRDSVSWRTFVEQLKFAFPEHRLSRRLPIGTEDVIMNAPRERFVEFYENWYTANRMAIIVVGDVEVDQAGELIEKHFADMKSREKREAPAMGKVSDREFATHYHYEEEAGETSVSIEALQSRINPPDDSARRAADLNRMIAGRIVNRRLERLAKKEDSPISSASMHVGDFFDLGFALYGSIDADCTPGNWEKAITVIEQELRRVLEYGFTENELEESKAVISNLYEEAAKQMGTRQSRDLANQIARRIGQRRIFTNPADDLPRVTRVLEGITTESCQEALRDLWLNADETMVLVSGNAVIEGEALASIEKAYRSSQSVAVTAPEEVAITEFAYDELPGTGEVKTENYVDDLDITQLEFTNGVHANLKPTDYEDNVVYVKVRIGSGLLNEPSPGLAFFLSSVFTKGGLEAHTQDDLQQLFAGESVGVSFAVDSDAFVLSGSTTPEDLRTQLVLMRAYLTNPGFRPEAATEFRRALDPLYQQLERTPGGFAQDEVAAFLHGNDPRFGFPPRGTVEKLTLSQAKDWLMPELEKGYMEISIVGDIDAGVTRELLAETFGSLPPRVDEKPDYAEQRKVSFPDATTKKFEFESEIPKGMAVVHWPTTDIFDIKKSRRLSMLSAVLDDRLRIKIREELGDAYSPFAHNLPSDTWKDYGYLFASVTIDPGQADSVTQVISEIAKELATGESITEDELERAKKPQVVQIEEMRRTNRYWLGSVLESSQENPERLDWSRSFVEDYKSISTDDVNALAKEFLSSDTQVNVTIVPKAE